LEAATPTELWVDDRLTGRVADRTPAGTVLDIDGFGLAGPRVHLSTVGDHNASNALLAFAAAWAQVGRDASIDRLLLALASFPGIGRRLEHKGEARGGVGCEEYRNT